MKLKIVTAATGHADPWKAALQRGISGAEISTVLQPMHSAGALVNGSCPDVLVVEVGSPGDFDALEALALAHPQIGCVLVGSELTADALMRAMRAGVREVLPLPVTPSALVDAVQRQWRRAAPTGQAVRRGEVLAFVSCKGGSGATFVAANLAHILADGGRRRVALLDLNLQFGDAALFITSQTLASHVAELARGIERLDAELLQSAMTQVDPGLWVLPAPDDPAQAADVSPQAVQAIVTQARALFDHVVIDVGAGLSPVSLQALDLADRVFPVLQLTLPYIRNAKRLQEVFRGLGYAEAKIHWIVNRHEKSSEITLDDLQRTLGLSALITLPNQYDIVATSVNQGLPVGKVAPQGAITRALREIARGIAPEPDKARGHWLSGLLRGGVSRTQPGLAT